MAASLSDPCQVCCRPYAIRVCSACGVLRDARLNRYVGEYLDDAGLLALQLFLSDRPDAGQVIPGTGGFQKLRWGDESRGRANVVGCESSICTYP